MKVLATSLVPGEGCLPGLQTAAFSSCLFRRVLIPFMRVEPS